MISKDRYKYAVKWKKDQHIIAEWLSDLQISQKEAAKYIGMGIVTYRKMLYNPKAVLKAHQLFKLCELITNISTATILEAIEERPIDNQKSWYETNPYYITKDFRTEYYAGNLPQSAYDIINSKEEKKWKGYWYTKNA